MIRARFLFAAISLMAPPVMADEPDASLADPQRRGLYLRLSLGPSWASLARETERRGSVSSFPFMGDTSSVSGIAAQTSLDIGASLSRRLVLAGTWIGFALPDAELELVDGTKAPLDSAMTSFFLGPTVDAIPLANGLHFGGGAGYVNAHASAPDTPGTIGGQGAAIVAAMGYDWFIDREWAIGFIGRALLGRLSGTHDAAGFTGSEADTLTSFSVSATVLLH